MSFSMTPDAIRNRTKTVTRRLAWWDLEPGTLLCAVEKSQGLKKGEKVVRLATIRVVSVECQSLVDICADYEDEGEAYGWREMRKEGFPQLTPYEFVVMFMRANNCGPGAPVNRIEFEYVDEEL